MFTRRLIANVRSVRFYTLGRWETNKNNKMIDTHVDWANHDHCGGEQCMLPSSNIIYNNDNNDSDDDNNDSNDDNNDSNDDNKKERKYVDYYSPFMVA